MHTSRAVLREQLRLPGVLVPRHRLKCSGNGQRADNLTSIFFSSSSFVHWRTGGTLTRARTSRTTKLLPLDWNRGWHHYHELIHRIVCATPPRLTVRMLRSYQAGMTACQLMRGSAVYDIDFLAGTQAIFVFQA